MLVSPEHLSIVFTTSPIKSNPSTEIIDLSLGCILSQPSLRDVHIYIICDSAKISPHDENKYKSGIVTQESFDNYMLFKQRIKAKYGKDNTKFTIIEREYRCGFAENIRFVMEKYAKTDHVMIYQHDYIIEKEIPFGEVIQMMRKYSKEINYVTFMNLSYINIMPKMEALPKVRSFFLKLLQKPQNYNLIQNIKHFTKDVTEFFKTKFGMPLMPLNFWYDKIHIASRQYYLDVVFNEKGNYDPNRGKNMKTVTFVEDTFGHCMKWTVEEEPESLLNKYCAFILWEDKPIFYHQSGRTFITQETRQGIKANIERGSTSSSQEDYEIQIGDFQKIITLEEPRHNKNQ